MAGRQRIVIASPHLAESEVLADWLASEGFDPVRASTPAIATEQVTARPFDLLIADAQFAFHDGLDAASRARRRNPRTPTVVLGASPVAQAQAEGRGAMYLNRPVDRVTLMCTVSMALMDERPVRRSPRKTVEPFDAIVDGVPAHIVDVSPEGLRLEVPSHRKSSPPPFFSVRVPLIGVALIVQRMWARRPRGERADLAWFGGALARNSARAEQAWRDFVDAIPGGGSHSTSLEVR